jgi:surface protein EP3-4 procyclin
MDAYSNVDPASWVRISVPEPTINGSGFTWDLSSVDFQGNQYFMYYETEGTETTSNSIQLKSRETTQGSRYQYVSQDSGGNGNGDNRPQPTPEPEPETPPTPTPTPEPTPDPQPVPTPQDNNPEPQPKPEPAKPSKKVRKTKKAALPSTGDDRSIAAVAGIAAIAVAFVIVSKLVRK